MANSVKTSAYSGHEYEASTAGCSCLRWFCFDSEVDGHHFLLQESGLLLRPQKETWVQEKFKNFTSKITSKRRNGQFQYSPETYALNFASELEQDENGDLLHSFSSRFASHR